MKTSQINHALGCPSCPLAKPEGSIPSGFFIGIEGFQNQQHPEGVVPVKDRDRPLRKRLKSYLRIEKDMVSSIIPSMTIYQIVIDTNVFVSALRSKRGASYKLFKLLGKGKFKVNVSVPLILEYEKTAKEIIKTASLSIRDIDDIIDYICATSKHQKICYLWRPFLNDPKDDMVLELAVSAHCDYIVTYNRKDFQDIDDFGIRVINAREFLKKIGELP
ncbi:MAG: putative toxin-antitoxin system toxin component, PIN family [PVC group bacterium]